MLRSKKLLAAAIVLSAVSFNCQVLAKSTGLDEIQDSPVKIVQAVSNDKLLSNDHWAYKTLEKLSGKYGLSMGKAEDKFDGNKPLTRNDAAIILINLTGKIEADNAQLGEVEKDRIEVLKEELKVEIQKLAGRVESLETSVDSLKGGVSKLEKSNEKAWKSDFGENFKIAGYSKARYTANFKKGADNFPSNFSIPESDLYFKGKLQKHIDFTTELELSRLFTSANKGLINEAYVSTDIIPHHKIQFGSDRVPVGGFEGFQSETSLDYAERSQISRKFGKLRETGMRVRGTWDFGNYDLAAFNGSGQNATDTDNKMDIAGWVVLKPLYKLPKYGQLELGSGYHNGKKTYHHETLSFYTGYKYKKFGTRFEYSLKDGYLNADQKASGWYVDGTYFVTDKIQVLGRFDKFDPNKNVGFNNNNEYTLGVNYFMHNQNLKLQTNLVHVDNQGGKDSNRLIVQTQYRF